MPDLEVLYEQGACLAVCKPPGLLTQAPPGIDSLEVRVKAFLQDRDGVVEPYLGVPHRLDRPASGVLVLGKDLRTTRKLGEQFEHRKVRKVYWACVEGRPDAEIGTWEDYVYKVPGVPKAEVVSAGHPLGRRAVLHYRVLTTGPWGAWLEIELETGRTHQIRVQAGSRGHPVLGDAQYGSSTAFGPQYEDVRLQAIALHARSLMFRDPTTREIVTVTAPLAQYWPAPDGEGFRCGANC
ncbi:MAG: RNA pseudouridine synthase [Thermoguttaceae bacterium]|jgi:RluA family pseudouridine synthase